MYGKTLSIPDTALPVWYDLLLGSTPPEDVSPRDAKHALARAIVDRFYGAAAGEEAAAGFERVFVSGELPEEIEEAVVQGNGAVHQRGRREATARDETREDRRSCCPWHAGRITRHGNG